MQGWVVDCNGKRWEQSNVPNSLGSYWFWEQKKVGIGFCHFYYDHDHQEGLDLIIISNSHKVCLDLLFLFEYDKGLNCLCFNIRVTKLCVPLNYLYAGLDWVSKHLVIQTLHKTSLCKLQEEVDWSSL